MTALLPTEWAGAAKRSPAHALGLTWQWLAHQQTGDPDTRQKALHLLGDQGGYEDDIRKNYTGRAAIELLQNAHDACADARLTGSVWFAVTPSALLVGNQGEPFTYERIISLTRLGSSEKAARRHRAGIVGYKGVGFTSVFELSDCPQVISKSTSFQFNRTRAQEVVGTVLGATDEPMPARAFPFALRPEDWAEDRDVVRALQARGAITVIRLPLRPDRPAGQVAKDVQDSVTPEILLFLPWVRDFELDDPGTPRTRWERRVVRRGSPEAVVALTSDREEEHRWLVAKSSVPVAKHVVDAVRDRLWSDIRKLNVAVALPWGTRGPDSQRPMQPVFAYFPTEDRLGRRVLIHGDFYLDTSRRHIESSHERGVISRTVGHAAAEMASRLAASYGRHGVALLESIAPLGSPSGFGAVLGEMLDERLKATAFLRASYASKLRRPADLQRISDGSMEMRTRLSDMLAERADIMLPADAPDHLVPWLTKVGTVAIDPPSLAERVRLDIKRTGYDRALETLHDWLGGVSGHVRSTVVSRLLTRPIVLDASGRWASPAEVILPSAGSPALPRFLRRPIARPPRRTRARQLLRELGVAELDAARALDIVIDSHRQRTPAGNEAARQTWAFVQTVWRNAPETLRARRAELGRFRVPTSTYRGKAVSWRRADNTYHPTDVLKDAYGPSGQSEFVASGAVARNTELLDLLGVAAKPRLHPLQERGRGLTLGDQWWRLPAVRDAQMCTSGHDQSPRGVDGYVIDRLDWLLERNVAILPRLLRASGGDPYSDVRIRCENTSHAWRAPWRSTTGYQSWRLETSPWIAVRGDPRARRFRPPNEAWADLPARSPWLVLPRAQISRDAAKLFRVVQAERPSPEAVESALAELASIWPELAVAPDEARRTADWLLRRLERILVRANRGRDRTPPLPAYSAGTSVWSETPYIPDIPGFPPSDEIPLLPQGRWPSLRAAYGLRRLSEVATPAVSTGVRRRAVKLLPASRRAQLLALMIRNGVDAREVAGRLAALGDETVSRLQVTWAVEGRNAPITTEPTFHLSVHREAALRARRLGATLYRAESRTVDNLALGNALAEYLDIYDRASELQLFLERPDELLAHYAVSDDDVDEALELLTTRRGFIRDVRSGVAADTDTVPEPSPTDGGEAPGWGGRTEHGPGTNQAAAPAPSPGSPAPLYVDPDAVGFGTGKSHAARAGKRQRSIPKVRGGTRTAPEYRRPAGSQYAGPITQNRVAEERAVAIVDRYFREVLGAVSVMDRQPDNCGWDLEARFKDRPTIYAEVKGSSGHTPPLISPNELRVARETENYELYHVAGLADPARTVMYRFPDLRKQLVTDSTLAVTGWAVVGWDELEYDEIPIVAGNGAA